MSLATHTLAGGGDGIFTELTPAQPVTPLPPQPQPQPQSVQRYTPGRSFLNQTERQYMYQPGYQRRADVPSHTMTSNPQYDYPVPNAWSPLVPYQPIRRSNGPPNVNLFDTSNCADCMKYAIPPVQQQQPDFRCLTPHQQMAAYQLSLIHI